MDDLAQTPEHGGMAGIVAQSRRQAMDWSLVLASQDIHPIITNTPGTSQWVLLVEPAQEERAREAIRLYRLENRGWNWRRELPGSTLEIHWGALIWCLFLAGVHWLVTFLAPDLEARGKMDSVAVQAGAWWRLFTPVLLHGDLAHLMANVTFGLLVLGLGMGRFGPGIALLAAYLAGVAGNVLGFLGYGRPYTGLGASGMMMGALGLLCVHSLGLWRKSPKAARYILSGVAAGVFIFVTFGVDPGSDVVAHSGGFLFGLLLGAGLAFVPEQKLQGTFWNGLCATALIFLIMLTWTLALT